MYRLFVFIEDFNVDAECLHFFDQHFEGSRNSWLQHVLALHDGLVRLDAANLVVRLHGEDFLQGVPCAVRPEGPNFHFATALTAQLPPPAPLPPPLPPRTPRP